MANSIWDSEVLVATIAKKKAGETIQIRECANKYGKFVDVRQYTGEFPTQKGICIPVDNLQAVALVLAKLADLPVVTEDCDKAE